MNLSLTNIKAGYKYVLTALGTAAIIWAFYLVLLAPQYERINELTAQYQQEQQKVDIIEAYVLAHPDADKHLAELEQQLAQTDKLLPDGTDISDFLLAAEQAAKVSGVSIVQIRPAPPVNKEGYREIPIEMIIRGNFFKTADFLKRVEEGPRFSAVKTMSIQAQQGVLESKMMLVVYSFGVQPLANPPAQSGKK